MWSSLSSCLTGELRQGYSTEMPGPHREETPRLPGENMRRQLYQLVCFSLLWLSGCSTWLPGNATWQEATEGRRGLLSPTVSEEIVHRGEGTGKVAGGLGILTSKQNRNWEENTGAQLTLSQFHFHSAQNTSPGVDAPYMQGGSSLLSEPTV